MKRKLFSWLRTLPPMDRHRGPRCLSSLIVAAMMSGCSWFGLGNRDQQPVGFGVVWVKVTPPPAGRRPTYVRATPLTSSRNSRADATQRLDHTGASAFVLPMGQSYAVTAFTDLNGNQIADAGEPTVRAANVIPASPLAAATPASTAELSFGDGRSPPQPAPTPAAAPSTSLPLTPSELMRVPWWLRERLER